MSRSRKGWTFLLGSAVGLCQAVVPLIVSWWKKGLPALPVLDSAVSTADWCMYSSQTGVHSCISKELRRPFCKPGAHNDVSIYVHPLIIWGGSNNQIEPETPRADWEGAVVAGPTCAARRGTAQDRL